MNRKCPQCTARLTWRQLFAATTPRRCPHCGAPVVIVIHWVSVPAALAGGAFAAAVLLPFVADNVMWATAALVLGTTVLPAGTLLALSRLGLVVWSGSHCVCGYSRAGLARGTPCPECGREEA